MLAGKFLFLTSVTTAQNTVMPIVMAALLLDSGIVGIWYLLGVILGNDRVKSSARNEMYQLVGTVILAMMIIGFMLAYGSSFFNVLSGTALMKPTAIGSLCTSLMSQSQLDLLGSPSGITGVASLLSGPQNPSGTQFEGICSLVQAAGIPTTDPTNVIDYPLAATATILANITNQTAANLESSFTFDAFIGFLATLRPSNWICQDDTDIDSTCIEPSPLAAPPSFEFNYYFQPFGGYDLLLTNLGTLGVLLTTAVEICCAQLDFLVICLYLWPYLLFIGLVLRATLFTRPLGGLFIAAALSIVLILPVSYAIEYLALAQPNLSNLGLTYGFTPATSIYPSMDSNGHAVIPYTINFFVQPNMKEIISTNGCWPSGGLEAGEIADIATLLIPGESILTGIISSIFVYQAPTVYVPEYCPPPQALSIFFELLQAYGLMGISIYLLPLLNIVILLTAMRGLSGLMGGDTELAGLARLIP
jgi:hypothetical protein